jgi:hypothetical protein
VTLACHNNKVPSKQRLNIKSPKNSCKINSKNNGLPVSAQRGPDFEFVTKSVTPGPMQLVDATGQIGLQLLQAKPKVNC